MDELVNKHINSGVNESSLSRIWNHNKLHDCGALTAFRDKRDCGKGEPYTRKEKNQRNKSLLSKLKSKGYGVTTLKGKYPEDGKSVLEVSFFVVDIKDSGKLKSDIVSLGDDFDQDSILFIPKGSINGDDKAFLVGTNDCKGNFLNRGQTMDFNKGKLGVSTPIYTSYVNGRPFIFENVDDDIHNPCNGMGVWAMKLVSEKHWSELDA